MAIRNLCMGVYEFNDDKKKLFNQIIKPIVESHTGLAYQDASLQYEANAVKMDLIYNQIEESKFAIADVSLKNENVFLEIGIAYALRKPIIFICEIKKFKDDYKNKLPFDIQGRELLLYENIVDLKQKLGWYITDAIYKPKMITVSWHSDTYINHVKSSSELIFSGHGKIWSSFGLNSNFKISYHVEIENASSSPYGPDVRLLIANNPETFPKIEIIFPWEFTENRSKKKEAHIDYFTTSMEDAGHRKQAVACAPKETKSFNVFISFCLPNLIVESDCFESGVERLILPIVKFHEWGYNFSLASFIGFEAKGAERITINNIKIKEVTF